jgi:hypothetical protein
MAQSTLTIDRLFDRSSRLPYPLRARTSQLRRWTMLSLFVVLSTVIGVYWYMTDTRRVRAMAEQYLTQLSGAQVTVGKATLSIFEGLRLDDVRVYAESPEHADPKSIRALPIFSASRFQISYDLHSMLRGKLEATRIVATNPRMLLAEDLDTRTWNYQKLARPQSTPELQLTGPTEPLKLPELQLRDARLEYIEVRGGVKSAVGSMALEGHLTASPEGNAYKFELQSRGISQGMGPSVSGAIDIHTGQVTSRLKNFTFGRDIKTMLPALIRNWGEQHQLAGRLDVPMLVYTPAKGDQPARFHVETELDGVELAVFPNEWMSRDEIAYLGHLRSGLSIMDGVYRTLYLGQPRRTPFEAMAELLETEPVRMQNVSGSFVFTENGLEVRNAGARIEGNSFRLAGNIAGYTPDAPLEFHLSSIPGENLVIPAAPKYVNAIPGVRELFLQLRPQGECRVEVNLKREDPGERAVTSGVVDLVNAQFQYVRFPYPVQRTTGRIEFGPDPKNGIDRLEIHELRGHGLKGGPNEQTVMTLKGLVAPLGPDAGFWMVIQSDKLVYEPLVQHALPPDTQEILKQFTTPEHPDALKFEGGFVTRVNREPGYDRDVYVETDVRLDDAAGIPAAFPYPLNNARGLLKIYDDHLDIIDVNARQGDATVKIEGRVNWTPYHERDDEKEQKKPRPPKNIISDIKLVASNVPIDDTLIKALPPEKRPMLQKLGITGRVDVKGMLTQRPVKTQLGQPPVDDSPMRYDLAMKVSNGGIHPKDTEWFVGDLTADVRVTPERLVFDKVTATRPIKPSTRPAAPTTQPNVSMVIASGAMDLTGKEPAVSATVSATNLQLDQAFYKILPKGTQEAWDDIRPDGTVDLTFTLAEGKDKPFTMTLRPRELAIQPAALPLKMNKLTGEVRVRDELVTFDNLQARSGDASLYIDGTQRMDQQDWNVKFAARDVKVTDEFLNAVPSSLKAAFTSLNLKGKIALDFDKLRVYVPPVAASQASTTQPTTTQAADPEIDLAATLWLDDASLDVGVPIEKAKGRFAIKTSIRQGHLNSVEGAIEGYSLSMAGREVTNFRGKLTKRPDEAGLRLDDIQAEVAGGTMAGRMDLIAGDPGPSRYVMNLSLRNADIAQLTQEGDQKIKGSLSASLSLEGPWGDPAARRGRGDVAVQGKQIVKLPLLLGLFQITNLALPITGPLNDATARYNIDGPVVTFERIELKGNNVLMSGDGKIDFDKRTVRLRFNADNPAGIKIPLLSDLLESGTKELLTITVKGTVEQPKVSGSTFNTITTTVDEVLNGEEKK